MKVQLDARFASDEDLLADLKRVAAGAMAVTRKFYNEHGQFHSESFSRRFGDWQAALALAGLRDGRPDLGHDEESWMKNIYDVWVALGRQPSYGDMRGSQHSPGGYAKRYGGWSKALLTFQSWINRRDSEDHDALDSVSEPRPPSNGLSRRDPNLRLRWKVIQRDRFTCVACGASPAITLGVKLHVDHVLPFSRGGKTELGNLQTLCETCNLGKADLPPTLATGAS